MKQMKLIVTAAVIFFACMFACSSAFAQDYTGFPAEKEGFWIRAGIGVPMTLNAGSNREVRTGAYTAVGVGLNLQLGYRWDTFAIQVEQDLGGAFVTDSSVVGLNNSKGQYFLGGTYLMFSEYANFDNFHISFGEGFGAMYGAKGDFHAFWVDSDAAFALKANIGFTYFFMDGMGAGFNFDYAIAFAIDNSGVTFSHFIQPVLTFTYVL
ncbi:MAG: hypothetical protein IJU23_09500 [Proteobacteria bacterium]|nr:hypothetical protein [Pseudomonadota bacterium]